MKLIYKNFTIEDDRACFILKETSIKKDGENKGEEFVSDVTYPSTLENALILILRKIKTANGDKLEFKEYIEKIKEINEKFIKDLKELKIK